MMQAFKAITAIAVSLTIAAMLMIWPVSATLNWLRPLWIPLVLLYWALSVPRYMDVKLAWLVGLMLDGLYGTLLASHGLACLLLIYVALYFRQRWLAFTFPFNALLVLFWMLGYQLILYLIQGFAGQPINTGYFWLASVTSAASWPFVYFILERVRRRWL